MLQIKAFVGTDCRRLRIDEPVTFSALISALEVALAKKNIRIFALPRQQEITNDNDLRAALAENSQGGDDSSSSSSSAGLRLRVYPSDGSDVAWTNEWADSLSFSVNGRAFSVNPAALADPYMSLNEWLRTQPGLTGTKRMCLQGFCGACAVVLSRHNSSGQVESFSINSCLRPLISVDGFEITTTEGMGNVRKGYSLVQNILANGNGSQCGFCSPGFVMTMHGLLANKSNPDQKTIENLFDGNLCRCTGYRSILTSMQSLAHQEGEATRDEVAAGSQIPYKPPCPSLRRPLRIAFKKGIAGQSTGVTYYRPLDLASALSLVSAHPASDIHLLVGNTSSGIFPQASIKPVLIDLAHIPELSAIDVAADGLHFGSAVSIAQVADAIEAHSDKSPTTFPAIVAHLRIVANNNVRNIASWAGNLRLTHDFPDFPSDLATVFCGVRASVVVKNSAGVQTYMIEDLMKADLNGAMMVQLVVPFASPSVRFFSYKVNPRRQSSPAIVNHALLVSLEPTASGGKLVVSGTTPPIMVYGGVGPHVLRAVQTEKVLVGKVLDDDATLQSVLASLRAELQFSPVQGHLQYRQQVSQSITYRSFLAAISSFSSSSTTVIPSTLSSAVSMLSRPVSEGAETFPTPLWEKVSGQPVPKRKGWAQAAGQVTYAEDTGGGNGGLLFAQFVISTQGNAKIDSVDPSPALAIPGVVDFVTKSDIPSAGTDMIPSPAGFPVPIFATDRVSYNGQALGLIVATSQSLADKAAQLVKVNYSDIQPVLVDLDDAIAKKAFFPDAQQPKSNVKVGDVDAALKKADKVVTSSFAVGSQYHMTMETQTCTAIPSDGEFMKVVSSCQYPSMTVHACASIIGSKDNRVLVEVKEIGGGYGGKILNSITVAAATTLAAWKLQAPVRCTLTLPVNMAMMGKRYPYRANFTVGVQNSGKIDAVRAEYISSPGWESAGDGSFGALFNGLDNSYNIANWDATAKFVKTNTALYTAARAPGYAPGIAFMESIIESVADALGKDPTEIREINMYKEGDATPSGDVIQTCSLPTLWQGILDQADVKGRLQAVHDFNEKNRWTKRGLCVAPAKYAMGWGTANYGVLINISGTDGTVQVNHSGVECGQGIDTKVAQVVARTLGCDLDLVVVTPTNTNINPNAMCTGGSTTSELNCKAAVIACNKLKERLALVKRTMQMVGSAGGDVKWADLIAQAFASGVDLSERYFSVPDTDVATPYYVFCVGVVEVEIDVLTGQSEILRADIDFDAGQSLNPDIDIGQIQGAFMMGVGWLTLEELSYDPITAKLITDSTWNYHVPSSQAIPQDFRIRLLPNSFNPVGVLGSKAVGEPPLCLAPAVFFALKRAIAAARDDAGLVGPFAFDAPATAVKIQQACGVDPSEFSFTH